MKIWYNNILDTHGRHVVEVVGNRVRIGRNPSNNIVLDSPFVAEEAAVLYKRDQTWELVVLSLDSIQVGEQEYTSGDRVPIDQAHTIKIFPFTLTLDLPFQQNAGLSALLEEQDEAMSQLIKQVHIELLSMMDLDVSAPETRAKSEEYLLTLERNIDEIIKSKGLNKNSQSNLRNHIAGHGVRSCLLESLLEQSGEKQTVWVADHHWSRIYSAVPEREEELKRFAAHIGELLELPKAKDLTQKTTAVEQRFWSNWMDLLPQIDDQVLLYLSLRYLKKEIKDIVFGYGPLEDLLRTPTISEIMVVDRDHIYIERSGVLENSGRRFISDKVTETIIERIVSKVGRRIDKAQPLVDARLTDGSRVNAVIPPLAVSGPCITIRKFPARKMLIEDLIAKGALTRTVAEFLRACVLQHCNVLISGGTGTGKTTLLNCLSDFIPDKERIVTIEDTAELQLKKEHVVRMETKAANIEGAGEYTIRDLVKNSLRMRPDRIVVGECRGGESLDMLQAMNTGHSGSMTTIHANTSEDVVLRLEVLVQMAAALPIQSIHRQIASAIDIIVQLTRMRNGARKITQVTEVVNYDEREGIIRMKDIFRYDPDAGQLMPTGRLPTFMGNLIAQGWIQLDSFYV